MKLRTLLLAASAVMAAGAAQAQTINFVPFGSGYVTDNASSENPADFTDIDAAGNAYRNVNGAGGTASARTSIDPDNVFFRSGVAVSGEDSFGTVSSGVNMNLYNPDDGQIALEDFTSTIIPAGLGFFMQDRDSNAANVFLDTGPTTTATFGDLFSSVGEFNTFAGASFDFKVTALGEIDIDLYTLHGGVTLSFDGTGNLVQTLSVNFESNLGQLVEYQNSSHVIHDAAFDLGTTLLWDWSATEILIPLSTLGNLNGYATKTLRYQSNVEAFTQSACINDGTACLVAFSAFGDPIGRGGADEEFGGMDLGGLDGEDDLARGHPFHTRAFNGLGFRELEFAKGQINSAAVPEPATWALMIGGFGLAGAALRRRRRAATA